MVGVKHLCNRSSNQNSDMRNIFPWQNFQSNCKDLCDISESFFRSELMIWSCTEKTITKRSYPSGEK